MNNSLVYLSVVFSLLIVSCHSNATESDTYFENVDNALWSFFDSFEKEGQKRGHNIDLSLAGITGEISTIIDDGVVGTCQFGHHIHHVTIDKEFWEKADYNLKEYVIFHELGHCYLDRVHNDLAFANGNCVSIMHSGLTDCKIVYGEDNRSEMLDELFYSE